MRNKEVSLQELIDRECRAVIAYNKALDEIESIADTGRVLSMNVNSSLLKAYADADNALVNLRMARNNLAEYFKQNL